MLISPQNKRARASFRIRGTDEWRDISELGHVHGHVIISRREHVLADNDQMRAHAQRVQAHLNTEDRTLTWAPGIVEQIADQTAGEDEQARRHVEGHKYCVWADHSPMANLRAYRQAEMDYWQTLTRLEKAGIADMLVSDVLAGNISNPITAEIERTVDELVRLCRVAGQLEADLHVRGKKRHAKGELKRINKIVDREKQHLLDGITAIRKSNNKNTQGEQ